jgi:4-hydroxy-tetrahydrodipicolinate synthase
VASPVPLRLAGVIPPMITPLTAAGEVDGAAIGRLVSYLVAGGVSGIFVLGTSGEGPWLSPAQAKAVIEATVRAAAGRAPVLAGVLEPSTVRALEAVAVAEAAGADALVVTSPYYFAVDGAAQVRHVAAIASATSLPLVLYNIPATTHNPFAPETVQRLAEIETVVGIKESSGDWSLFEQLLALRAARPRWSVLQGAEQSAARAVLAGADGLVPGLGNLAPVLFAGLVRAAAGGSQAAALDLQARVDALWRLHTHGFWLACLKYAASLLGFGSGAVSGNAAVLVPEAQAAIRRLVEQQGLVGSSGDAAP